MPTFTAPRARALRFVSAGLFLSLGFAALPSFAQSVPASNHECSWMAAAPALSCANPVAGTQVQFFLTEYQGCENGHVSDAHQLTTLLEVFDSAQGRQVYGADDEDMQVQYAAQRTHLDNRTNDVSLFLPTSVQASVQTATGQDLFQIEITPRLVQAPGAVSGYQVLGTFKKLNAQKKVVDSGNIQCTVIAD